MPTQEPNPTLSAEELQRRIRRRFLALFDTVSTHANPGVQLPEFLRIKPNGHPFEPEISVTYRPEDFHRLLEGYAISADHVQLLHYLSELHCVLAAEHIGVEGYYHQTPELVVMHPITYLPESRLVVTGCLSKPGDISILFHPE